MIPDSEESEIDHYQACIIVLERGVKELSQSNLAAAGQLFNLGLQIAEKMPSEMAGGLHPLGLCFLSLLAQRGGDGIRARQLREQVMPLVDGISLEQQTVPFHNLMSNALIALQEYRRAIPFCEQAIQLVLEREQSEPTAVAELLAREGLCYIQCGLKDQAAVPLRAAVKILRDHPGDPRLAAVLVTLGNAVRKSSPAEAEQLYQEVADIHAAKAQMESATTAWVNLGILCSEQGRHAESLAHYQRALRVREQSRGTPPGRVGSLLNNMANCYRRMGDFNEALRLVDRAIKLLKPEDGSPFPSAYGTRGQILHGAGRDAEAVEWLQKSYEERMRSSSPDLDAVIENLEIEIESLMRLGRLQEAEAAEGKLARAKTEKAEAPRANVDVSALKDRADGAVMVELAFGSRPGSGYRIQDAEVVAEQMAGILEERDTGFYGGRVVIPESTTLWFYGADGEAIFQAIEQFLKDHLICAGATIAIRQGGKMREVVIPQQMN
jgi:tetratricopeptide (TPR) repeat protein